LLLLLLLLLLLRRWRLRGVARKVGILIHRDAGDWNNLSAEGDYVILLDRPA
jgi:hypothetical protein